MPWTPDILAQGRDLFLSRCAVCHGHDGSGRTDVGVGLYPRVPDVRAARTQTLTDGEIHYIIENGVQLTGMPAWGNRHNASSDDSWKLTVFIRTLSKTLGETNFLFFPDCTAHKNRMQGNDFVQSLMYRRGITCFTCHDVHGTGNYAQLRKPADKLCPDCHWPGSPNTRTTKMEAPAANASPATCRRLRAKAFPARLFTRIRSGLFLPA